MFKDEAWMWKSETAEQMERVAKPTVHLSLRSASLATSQAVRSLSALCSRASRIALSSSSTRARHEDDSAISVWRPSCCCSPHALSRSESTC